jgi:subtilisin family serine protease
MGDTGVNGVEGGASLEGHGTAMASLIPIITDNVGIAGDCCNVNLMLLKAFKYVEYIIVVPDDTMWTDVIEAINYAVNNGAKVINMSFGSLESDLSPRIRTNIQNAINNAYNNDVVVVTGAGSWGDTSTVVPANAGSSVLSVGGLASDFDSVWERSNYGTGIDLWAPAENVYSFWNTNYLTSNGISNASAIVTACVAMVRILNPMLTAEEVMSLVANNTDSVSADDVGGRVNFLKAARAAVALRNMMVD